MTTDNLPKPPGSPPKRHDRRLSAFEKKRSRSIQCRFSDDEVALIEKAAAESFLTPASWLRMVVLSYAKNEGPLKS